LNGTPLQLTLHVGLLATAIVFYYASVDRIGEFLGILSLPESLRRRFPARHVEAAFALVYAGILQAFFFVVLILTFRPATLDLRSLYCDPVLGLLGIILGIGEMGLSTQLAFAAIVTIETPLQWSRNVPQVVSRRDTAERIDWATTARGGWMQYYMKAMTVLPWPVGAACVLLYVFFEEGVFRGVILGSLAPLGSGPALAISVLLFMLVQTFHTPGWRTSMFPVIGALVLGIVNGALYLIVPKLVPLALAHASFFFSAFWSIRKLDVPPRMNKFG